MATGETLFGMGDSPRNADNAGKNEPARQVSLKACCLHLLAKQIDALRRWEWPALAKWHLLSIGTAQVVR